MYQVLDVRLLKIPGTVEELAPLAREYGFDGLDVPEAILGGREKSGIRPGGDDGKRFEMGASSHTR